MYCVLRTPSVRFQTWNQPCNVLTRKMRLYGQDQRHSRRESTLFKPVPPPCNDPMGTLNIKRRLLPNRVKICELSSGSCARAISRYPLLVGLEYPAAVGGTSERTIRPINEDRYTWYPCDVAIFEAILEDSYLWWYWITWRSMPSLLYDSARLLYFGRC